MAIKFFNIRSKEIRVAETEPMIAAMYNSSDRSPNAMYGQDFGWRLAPEVVVELKRIRKSEEAMQKIATWKKKSIEDLNEIDLLDFMSAKTAVENAPVAVEGDYEDQYLADIKSLEGGSDPVAPAESPLATALIEAAQLGIDVSKLGADIGLIKGAIKKWKRENSPKPSEEVVIEDLN